MNRTMRRTRRGKSLASSHLSKAAYPQCRSSNANSLVVRSAELTRVYHDISNTWLAHGFLSSSSYDPSQADRSPNRGIARYGLVKKLHRAAASRLPPPPRSPAPSSPSIRGQCSLEGDPMHPRRARIAPADMRWRPREPCWRSGVS